MSIVLTFAIVAAVLVVGAIVLSMVLGTTSDRKSVV